MNDEVEVDGRLVVVKRLGKSDVAFIFEGVALEVLGTDAATIHGLRSFDDILAGRYPQLGACPHCGRFDAPEPVSDTRATKAG